jgi:hypothetical protein
VSAESGYESETDAIERGVELGMRDAEVPLYVKTGYFPTSGVWIPIACTGKKLRNRRFD